MQAELRALVTVEHEPLSSVRPATEAFCTSLRALIGPVGLPGAESFDFDVCSPAWLVLEVKQRPVICAEQLLIVDHFDPREIEEYVQKRIAHAAGDDWATIAGKLARWSHWEFSEYRSYKCPLPTTNDRSAAAD